MLRNQWPACSEMAGRHGPKYSRHPQGQLIQELKSEEHASSQAMAAEKSRLEIELKNLYQKLDRLLDAHLDGSIEKSEYLGRKERFLNQKLQIEDKLSKMIQGAMPWLEPCSTFLKVALQAHQLATTTNLEAKKKFLQMAGSNHRLSARRLAFAWREPWGLLAQNSRDFMALGGSAGEEAGAQKFFNPIGFHPLSPSCTNLRATVDDVRTKIQQTQGFIFIPKLAA